MTLDAYQMQAISSKDLTNKKNLSMLYEASRVFMDQKLFQDAFTGFKSITCSSVKNTSIGFNSLFFIARMFATCGIESKYQEYYMRVLTSKYFRIETMDSLYEDETLLADVCSKLESRHEKEKLTKELLEIALHLRELKYELILFKIIEKFDDVTLREFCRYKCIELSVKLDDYTQITRLNSLAIENNVAKTVIKVFQMYYAIRCGIDVDLDIPFDYSGDLMVDSILMFMISLYQNQNNAEWYQTVGLVLINDLSRFISNRYRITLEKDWYIMFSKIQEMYFERLRSLYEFKQDALPSNT
jgi:hypothetical protein